MNEHADILRRWQADLQDNIWIGVSCENQEMADKRIPELLKIPAKVRFLSLLGPIALSGTRPDRLGAPINFDWLSGIHWVIVGGESGHGARPCNIEWIRSIVRQCKQAGVPVFVKQLGSLPYQSPECDNGTGYELSLHHPKGGDMSEWPEDLRVRQMPGGAK